MAEARQSEPDQSVNAETAAEAELARVEGVREVDFAVQSLA